MIFYVEACHFTIEIHYLNLICVSKVLPGGGTEQGPAELAEPVHEPDDGS